ncbi:SDR family NAD(P)-dependent oxidoreductase [Evansella sp. AB-P1]|uniref:SDR family NAD(P)-dependent oxidoreductase n=1 Tax=Evansella sp. AB-P1 TaxID=3037653 RepID=UPI00241FAE57|nr:SDR family NAD(P)-dependent oxidoreductase [Evansella sp. AB-P1]MDG5788356.1 SDR family NAD(P)-dependent oxidoreductase [Evansella sp. AB-P1]
MNILITGGTGFVGSTLVKKLLEDQHHVYILARSQKKVEKLLQSLSSKQLKFLNIIEGDLSLENVGLSKQTLKDLTGTIDAVYHSAAFLSFDEEDREKLFHINVNGTKNLLNVSKTLGIQKFIHVSTAYTLGESTQGYEELYPIESTSFVNSYEESKCVAEHVVMTYKDHFDVTIMRPGIVIGDSITGEADTTFGLYGVLRAVELLKKRATRLNEASGMVYRLLVDKTKVSHLVPVDYISSLLALGLLYGKKNTIYNLVNPTPPSNELVIDSIKEGLEFEYIDLVSNDLSQSLSETEIRVNQQLVVFKEYLNRSIFFRDENTRELLSFANESLLQMDKDMLLRIVSGFRNRRELVTN